MKYFTYFFIVCLYNVVGFAQDSTTSVSALIVPSTTPIAVIQDVDLHFTSKGKFKSQLKAGTLLDFSHLLFPYYFFPKKVHLDLLDDNGKYNTVLADQAIFYKDTQFIELYGAVEIKLADGTVLKTDTLYWDQSLEWLYTDTSYQVFFKNGSSNKGVGFDANQDFTKFTSRSNDAIGINL